jgi:hypothetical protein
VPAKCTDEARVVVWRCVQTDAGAHTDEARVVVWRCLQSDAGACTTQGGPMVGRVDNDEAWLRCVEVPPNVAKRVTKGVREGVLH